MNVTEDRGWHKSWPDQNSTCVCAEVGFTFEAGGFQLSFNSEVMILKKLVLEAFLLCFEIYQENYQSP